MYFDVYWYRQPAAPSMHLLAEKIRGQGPWKVGGSLVALLDCQVSHPEQAAAFAAWQSYIARRGSAFPSREDIETRTREHDALLDA